MSRKAKETRTNQKEPFSPEWQKTGFRSRAVRICFEAKPAEEMAKLYDSLGVAGNLMSRRILEALKSGKLNKKEVKSKNSKIITKIYKSAEKELLALGLEHNRYKRSVTTTGRRMIASQLIRNDRIPSSPPRMRAKRSLFIDESAFQLCPNNGGLTGKILVPNSLLPVLPDGKKAKQYNKMSFNYWVPHRQADKLPYINATGGGYLIRNKNNTYTFVVRATIPVLWRYKPTHGFAYDCNMGSNGKNFLVLSEKIMYNGEMTNVLPHTPEVRQCVERLQELAKLLKIQKKADNPHRLNSRQRRPLQLERKKVHKRLEMAVRPYHDAIIAHVIKYERVLCIDDLTCGASTGSFGQDAIRKLLTTTVEDQGIPFVRVPTKYTSKTCYFCWSESERLNADKIFCPKCGELDAHNFAALNIGRYGLKIWEAGIKTFEEWRVSNYKPRSQPKLSTRKPHRTAEILVSGSLPKTVKSTETARAS